MATQQPVNFASLLEDAAQTLQSELKLLRNMQGSTDAWDGAQYSQRLGRTITALNTLIKQAREFQSEARAEFADKAPEDLVTEILAVEELQQLVVSALTKIGWTVTPPKPMSKEGKKAARKLVMRVPTKPPKPQEVPHA